ncbi:fucose isomerase [Agrococcus sp. Marseille-P2731]|uniref:fucose isomerase n=1 Tax=Agrococcus sp. Marseille-P2731 TaxID=1841862 RepID=UPI000930A437|nr:fucose isomerase [Agrococcus sp. Marseille-P2731]
MPTDAVYALPTPIQPPSAAPRTVYLVASGDGRPAANTAGWSTQEAMERDLAAAFEALGWSVERAHPFDAEKGHGFIDSQRMGIEVFRAVPLDAPVVVAEAVWQYSSHVLAGLRKHRGPVLTVGNFAADWPGLVGLLNLNGGLTKMQRDYATLWSVDFTDEWFRARLAEWVETGTIVHDASHVRDLPPLADSPERELGVALAEQLRSEQALIGIFDEGCMGMYNAIIDDELLNPIGIYKERLSQSALFAEMRTVSDEDAAAVIDWLRSAGMTFRVGTDHDTELTEAQLLEQARMYVAAVRMVDDFGLDAVGIQYQQGLKDLTPASDLVEGILNNVQRPPVSRRDGSTIIREGASIPHFNEVDEGVAVDALITTRIWTAMGLDPANTLHDVRWGEEFDGRFVWAFEISGSVPPSHLEGGYAGAEGWRQGNVFFPAGGSTINGVSRAGEIVWSRVYVMDGALHVDMGRGSAIALPDEESTRRKEATNPEWPIMHAVLHGVSRDQFMGRHKANHVQVAYAPDAAAADRALVAKAAMLDGLGIHVHLAGDVSI